MHFVVDQLLFVLLHSPQSRSRRVEADLVISEVDLVSR
jgi:hypothetical protein